MTTRLEKFRGYMARFNPSGEPRVAVRNGLYVPRPGRSTADEVAARLELDPTSSHLIVGGIGSGKTTQLLVACDRLNKLEDTRAEYIDLSLIHDLQRMDAGTLIIAAGLAARRHLEAGDDKVALDAGEQFRRWAYGHQRRVWIPFDDEVPYGDDEPPSEPEGYYDVIEEKPLLSLPEAPLEPFVADKALRLSQVRSGLRERLRHLVLLFDSLDRLSDPAAFATVVEQDVRAIQKAGIGLVLVGPLRTMFGPHRTVTDHFQHFYPQHAVDVQQDERGRSFLVDVLQRRAPPDLLSEPVCRKLAELSGGVLRDLIALARAAGEEAYMRGSDRVEEEHIDVIADAFGRQLLFGLKPAEIEVLQRVRQTGAFTPTSDDDMALLMTRRVLEYRNGSSRFAVQPMGTCASARSIYLTFAFERICGVQRTRVLPTERARRPPHSGGHASFLRCSYPQLRLARVNTSAAGAKERRGDALCRATDALACAPPWAHQKMLTYASPDGVDRGNLPQSCSPTTEHVRVCVTRYLDALRHHRKLKGSCPASPCLR